MTHNALVISGGTARGAYAAGLVHGLFTRFPSLHQHLQLFSGTSTGSLIAPALALYCLDPARHRVLLDQLVTRYQVPSTEAFLDEPDKLLYRALKWVLTPFLGKDAARAVAKVAETGAVVDASPLKRTVDTEYTDARLTALFAARQRVQVYVNCVSAQTGGLVAFSSADPSMTPARFRTAIFASCMQPLVMPLVSMDSPAGVQELMDGGIRDVVPVESTFYGGATRVLALALFPDGEGLPKPGPFSGRKHLKELAQRVVFDLLDGEVQDDDVLEARLLASLGQLVRHARAHGADDAAVTALLSALRPEERARFLVPDVLHGLYVHRPARGVPLVETLRWDRDGMQASIDAGRAAALSDEGQRMHDFLAAP